MAKFGLFEGGADKPKQEYEGHRFEQHGEYVTIYDARNEQVAAIRMKEDQSIKKIG